MNNGLLIALAIIFVVILLAINIYLLALYVHTDDKGFGTALYCKVLVVLGLTLCQAQALLVPLDVANASALDVGGIDMKGFWYFVYLTVLIFICLLLPFALFFYETDEDDGYCKRITRAVCYTLAANIISILLLFITWNFFKFVELPVHTIAAGNVSALTGDLSSWASQSENDTTL
jgi:LMBR1 domain-containing protein 1